MNRVDILECPILFDFTRIDAGEIDDELVL